MPPLLPREIRWNASVISSHRLRPSPQSDRVGISISVTRLPVGSLALRPAALPQRNLQPPVTRTLLPGARKVYGQLLSQDLNPIDMQPLRHTTSSVVESFGFFKNRTEIPRRFASRNDNQNPALGMTKSLLLFPSRAARQLGQSEAYRGDPTRCLACGEKDRDWENCHSGRAFGKVRVLLVIFVIGGGFSLNFTPVARW